MVTSFRSGMRFPQQTVWWAPNVGIEEMQSEVAALHKALPATVPVAPSHHLPTGYLLAQSEVHTDPYSGAHSAVFAYTDGVDHIFVRQNSIPVVARPVDDTIAYFDREGITQCMFTHRGVEFMVVGRSVEGLVRQTSEGIYQSAIVNLK
jgi:hypothetical protein